MKTYDLVELASRNLRESVLRNGLTTAGIAVGVASLLAMVSLGVGLQQLAGKRLSSSGLFDTISVSTARENTGRNQDEPRTEQDDSQPRILDEDARREIQQLPNVIEVQPEIRFLAEVRYENRAHVSSIGGLAPSARQNESFDNIQGRYFSGPSVHEAIVRKEFAVLLAKSRGGSNRDANSDSNNNANGGTAKNQAAQSDDSLASSVLGRDLILRYAERQPLAGNSKADGGTASQKDDDEYAFSVVRREETLRIVGMIDAEPFGGMRASARANLFIPSQLAEDLNIMQAVDVPGAIRTSSSKKTYNVLMVRISNPSNVQAVQDSIRKMGFRTFSILDASRGLRRFFTVLDLFLGIFGSLALAVASLGIINTLVMAVLERRREIGILKAVGASDGDVQKLFFAEAGAMGLAGGVFGVLLGGAIGAGINFGTKIYLRNHALPPETVWASPGWLVAAAIVFAVLVSLASGLYPARRAAKLDPVQALRYE